MTAIETYVPKLQRQTLALLPQPADITVRHGRLTIDDTFTISLAGYREPRLIAAAERFLRRLTEQTGIPIDVVPLIGSREATVVVDCSRAGDPVQSLGENEGYSLDVTSTQGCISAISPLGVLNSLETLLQLITHDELGFGAPAIHIQDSPRFPWRGLMLDVVRHWMPVEVVKRMIDAMAAVKLNVFHWHLTDDQGYRIESHAYPKLHELGSDGLYYTQAEIRDVVGYASERGIRVIPEIDVPGHATAWVVAYPEYASKPGPYEIERKWGIHDPTLDPTREETYEFLDAIIKEVAGLFPDRYFHIGGDEVSGTHWTENASIQSFMRRNNLADNAALQAYFTQRVYSIVKKYGKTMIGWDEVLHADISSDVVIHSWRGQDSLADAARKGHSGILSHGYYLDMMQPSSTHYAVDPLDGATSHLTPAEQSLILGGEACMWTEYSPAEMIDGRIWPRTAAIAERLWSPAAVHDTESLYRRLSVMSGRLEMLGVNHRRSPSAMLDRLAGGVPDERLRILAECLEPAKGYSREWDRHYTSATPQNRMVDAILPESDRAREFSVIVRSVSTDPASVRRELTRWHNNAVAVAPLLEHQALLQEVCEMAGEIATAADIGLRALDYIDAGRPAPQAWVRSQLEFLEAIGKPHHEMIIPIVPSVRELVEQTRPADLE